MRYIDDVDLALGLRVCLKQNRSVEIDKKKAAAVATAASHRVLYSTQQQSNTFKMAAEGMEQWDLTPQISPYLDRHMTFPLLEYLDGLIGSGTVNYESKDEAAARLALLRPTHMVDYAIDIYKGLHGADSEIPKEMEEQKANVYKTLEDLEQGCKALHDLCGNEDEKVSV